MKYYYEETESYETVRWFRWKKDADVRLSSYHVEIIKAI